MYFTLEIENDFAEKLTQKCLTLIIMCLLTNILFLLNKSRTLIFNFLVSQNCDEDGMEFTMRIPEGFRGRIYTHKHYGRSQCYVRGTGGKTYTLRIPGVNGFPDCGTEKVRDFKITLIS